MKIKKQIKKIFLFIVIFEIALISANFWMIVEKMSYDICGSACKYRELSKREKVFLKPLSVPDSILIEKINVRAPLIFNSGMGGEAVMENLNKGVVYYPGSNLPDEKGIAVFLGHSSNYWWSKSAYSNVFALIPELETGDEIKIFYQNRQYRYQAVGNKIIKPSQWDQIKSPEIESGLALITCWPLGSALRRYVVFAEKID
jgi:LPXTG-site transpeptidase (sortase) family protein